MLKNTELSCKFTFINDSQTKDLTIISILMERGMIIVIVSHFFDKLYMIQS